MAPNIEPISDLRIAVICSSNMNRSMEAHAFLSKKGFLVQSFGTGDKVKLPGSAADKPNVYEFGVSYEEIYQDLLKKDKTLYPLYLIIIIYIVSFSAVNLPINRPSNMPDLVKWSVLSNISRGTITSCWV